MTPQEQEVAFQRQALENGQAVLANLQNELAAAQTAGASAEQIADIQQRINGQIRVNGFTQENLAEAQSKLIAGQPITEAQAIPDEIPEDAGTQFVDDGGGLNVLPEDQFTETEGGLNVLTEELEEDPINDYEPDSPEELGTDAIDASAQTGAETSDETDGSGDKNDTRAGVPRGATPSRAPGAQAQWSEAKDLRVKLRVPNEYLKGPSAGPASILQKNGGILFPYTPSISMDNQAQYASQNPLHSNFPLYFYKHSSVGPITVNAKFTVQNEFEGAVLLGVLHLLRVLTKMKWGNDPDAGSPPPVCRFDAYGDYMLYNVPVSIASWRHELPDGVDYIAVGRPGSPGTYGRSMVPVLSTISLTMNIMYSRREMLEYNTKDWLSGGLRYRGYL